MDTLIPSAADLAGDPAVISRAEALRPAVEAAGASRFIAKPFANADILAALRQMAGA